MTTTVAIVSLSMICILLPFIPFPDQVGVAAELPSGSYSPTNLDHESFFQFLLNSGEAYERIPADRFDIDMCVFFLPPRLRLLTAYTDGRAKVPGACPSTPAPS